MAETQLDHAVVAEGDDAVDRPRQRSEHVRRPPQQSGIVRRGPQRPGLRAVRRQLEPQQERRERIAQAHDGRGHAQVGRDCPKQRLQHPQVDPGELHLAGAQELGIPHRGRQRAHARVDEARDGRLGRERHRLLVAGEPVADVDHGVAGLGECRRKAAQVGHGAAAEDGALDDPRSQPPRPHRRAGRPVTIGEQIRETGQRRQAAHLDGAPAPAKDDGLVQPSQRVGQAELGQEIGPAPRGERRERVKPEHGLLHPPRDEDQLERRPPRG